MLKKSVLEFVLYSLICGIIYPLLIYVCGSAFFTQQANGSLINNDSVIIGSKLVGQNFSDPKYFWGRPSATLPASYNGLSSSGSNIALSNPAFKSALKERAENLGFNDKIVPVELVTASGSGLDPEISVAAAKFQAERISKARQLSLQKLLAIIDQQSKKKSLGFMGTVRVNVLLLNIELDKA